MSMKLQSFHDISSGILANWMAAYQSRAILMNDDNTQAIERPPIERSKIAARSDSLLVLRSILSAVQELKLQSGPLARFHVVIDANVLIREVLWLTEKRKSPNARTALQESIAAGTIIAYATPHVMSEVHEHLPRVAGERGRPPEPYLEAWVMLQKSLIIQTPSAELVEKYAIGQDPDDAPTLALAEAITAAGILSLDTDIKAMGGTVIPLHFTLAARDYSRDAAVSVTCELGGYVLFFGAGTAVVAAIRGISSLIKAALNLPPAVKYTALALGILWLTNPKNRESLARGAGQIINRLGDTAATVLTESAGLIQEAEQRRPAELKLPPPDA